jgi:hypothetical protein
MKKLQQRKIAGADAQFDLSAGNINQYLHIFTLIAFPMRADGYAFWIRVSV